MIFVFFIFYNCREVRSLLELIVFFAELYFGLYFGREHFIPKAVVARQEVYWSSYFFLHTFISDFILARNTLFRKQLLRGKKFIGAHNFFADLYFGLYFGREHFISKAVVARQEVDWSSYIFSEDFFFSERTT